MNIVLVSTDIHSFCTQDSALWLIVLFFSYGMIRPHVAKENCIVGREYAGIIKQKEVKQQIISGHIILKKKFCISKK